MRRSKFVELMEPRMEGHLATCQLPAEVYRDLVDVAQSGKKSVSRVMRVLIADGLKRLHAEWDAMRKKKRKDGVK